MSSAFVQQQPVDILGGWVPHLRCLEQVDDPAAAARGLEAGVLEVVGLVHRPRSGVGRRDGRRSVDRVSPPSGRGGRL